jgi:hypothetical protein
MYFCTHESGEEEDPCYNKNDSDHLISICDRLTGLPIVPVIGILIVRKEMIMSQKTITARSTLPI